MDRYRYLKPSCSGKRHQWVPLPGPSGGSGAEMYYCRHRCRVCGHVRRTYDDTNGTCIVDYLRQ